MIHILTFAALSFAQPVDRTKPPETPPLAPYQLPAVRESKLPNGLSVSLVEDKRFPLVTIRLAFRAGSRNDPPGKSGLAESIAGLLKEGTSSRSSRQIAEELAAMGGSLDASAGSDALTISGNTLAENLAKLLDLTADVARNASFPQAEIDLRKQNRLQELDMQRAQSETLADEKLHGVVFGAHPYARTLPAKPVIQGLTREQLASFRDTWLTPANAFLILVGALPPEKETLDVIHAKFGSWTGKPVPPIPGGEWPKPARSITLIDRPGSAQVDVQAGHVTVNRSHADYFPLLVANNILGGGTSSRLFTNLREKKGFAYSVYSHHNPYRETGMIAVTTQVREEVLEQAMAELFAEMDRMGKQRAAAQELSNTKNYMNGIFVLQLASMEGLAGQLAGMKINGMSNDYLERYVPRIRSVEPDQVQSVSSRYLSPAEASIVVVGDASRIARTLAKFGKLTVEKAQ